MPDTPTLAQRDLTDTGLITERAKPSPKTKKPRLYKVIIFNDDYTPVDFVTALLINLFGLSLSRADQLTSHIHNFGTGVCGIFPKEIAETKVHITRQLARQHQHPLQCTLEGE